MFKIYNICFLFFTLLASQVAQSMTCVEMISQSSDIVRLEKVFQAVKAGHLVETNAVKKFIEDLILVDDHKSLVAFAKSKLALQNMQTTFEILLSVEQAQPKDSIIARVVLEIMQQRLLDTRSASTKTEAMNALNEGIELALYAKNYFDAFTQPTNREANRVTKAWLLLINESMLVQNAKDISEVKNSAALAEIKMINTPQL